MPVTYQDVESWGKFTASADESIDELQRVVTAVTEHIVEHYHVADPMTAAQEQAVILQAARLWRRRDTPEGVAAFADVQALRIDSLDRDVAMLLTPKICFS